MFLFLPLSAPSRASGKEAKLTVAAAADLAFALKDMAAGFEKEAGVKTVISFGSTGMLAKQIENNAPFDLFFAADARTIETLRDNGYVEADTITRYADGALALVVNKKSGVKVSGIKDLLRPEMKWIAIAQPLHAPYGRAAMEALKNAGVWEKIKYRIVYGESVRQALAYVQNGDATAGIIALSVADVPEVEYIAVDPSLHSPIRQSAAVITASKEKTSAREFLNYVTGKKGREILKKYRFILP